MSHIELDLLAYLDGELSPAEMQAAEAHIAGCPACAAELVELQRLRVGLSTVVPVVYQLCPPVCPRRSAHPQRFGGSSAPASSAPAWPACGRRCWQGCAP